MNEKKLKILTTGVGGFIGSAIFARINGLKDKYQSVGLTRYGVNDDKGLYFIKINDLCNIQEYQKHLEDMDVIVHTAGVAHIPEDNYGKLYSECRRVNIQGTLVLAEKAAAVGVKRFIFLSSVKVNGNETRKGRAFSENDEPDPQDIYGKSKYETEKGLVEISEKTGMEIVIIRPPLVYGPGVKGNMKKLLQLVGKNVPLPLASVDNKRSFVFIDNLVDFVLVCIDHPGAKNQIFLVSDDRDISTTELVEMLSKVFGKKKMLFPVPKVILGYAASLFGQGEAMNRLLTNLQVDITKAKEMLNWVPPYSLEEGFSSLKEGIHSIRPEKK